MSIRSLTKCMNALRHTCPLYIYELVFKSYSYWDVESCIYGAIPDELGGWNQDKLLCISHHLQTFELLSPQALLLHSGITLFLWGMQQESLGREQFVCLEMMIDRQTCTTTNPGSILQVRWIWLCRCRWWSWRVGSTLHQPIEVDGLRYSGSFSYRWDC